MFFRIIKFAFQNFYRNFWLAIVTITMLVVTLFSVTTLISLNVVSDQVIKSIENKIDVSVYFHQDADESQILKAKIGLSNLPEVEKITFVNKEEALDLFKEKYKDNQSILSSIDVLNENPLPNFFIIKAKNSEYYPKILDELNKSDYNKIIKKKDFDDHKIFINKISSIKNKTKKMGFIVIAIFSFIASLIVFNTVRIAIYTHRDEIKIMRLVGATNWFIRVPFLLEEFFYAFISLLILMSFFYPLLNFIQPHLNYFLEYDFDLISYFKNNFFFIFGLEFLVVILINTISSFLAMKKYLKV
ncbi:MAG: permease-like cell division protein FtsX [Patescibacteria group bacterium]|nr:permease-like cell division protein FtsX [Patescibacteria group bacterium]